MGALPLVFADGESAQSLGLDGSETLTITGVDNMTPRKQLAVTLTGEATVRASDGDIIEFTAGDVILLNDRDCKGHLIQIRGDHDATILLVGLDE